MSDAMLREILDTGALRPVARAFARKADGYKRRLAACDITPRDDLQLAKPLCLPF